MKIKRSKIILKPDARRVILKSFTITGTERVSAVIGRIMKLSDEEVLSQLQNIGREFTDRHRDIDLFFENRFVALRQKHDLNLNPGRNRCLLIGAYFSHEYSIESAALFNPSIVWHPDQSGFGPARRRFILSLRATGEGHISSIRFRSGSIDGQNNIKIDAQGPYNSLPVVRNINDQNSESKEKSDPVYEMTFDSMSTLDERVIFPQTASESNGIEDARFVQFIERGHSVYYATYTAYDGRAIRPRLIATEDFLKFKVFDLHGPVIVNKGLALFPQKIGGRYAMLSRQDNENNRIMFSDDLFYWSESEIVQPPVFPWEFIQLGNCGSPLKTEAGWLVLSHGVGAMRKYAIGAFLLDLKNPRKLIGRTSEPLISPNEKEREGYVPNVVYSCGGIIHQDQLIIPYAMSDAACTFGSISLSELLHDLTR